MKEMNISKMDSADKVLSAMKVLIIISTNVMLQRKKS